MGYSTILGDLLEGGSGTASANQVGPDLTIVNTTKTMLTEVQLVSPTGEHVSLTKNLAPGQQAAVHVETKTGGCMWTVRYDTASGNGVRTLDLCGKTRLTIQPNPKMPDLGQITAE